MPFAVAAQPLVESLPFERLFDSSYVESPIHKLNVSSEARDMR